MGEVRDRMTEVRQDEQSKMYQEMRKEEQESQEE